VSVVRVEPGTKGLAGGGSVGGGTGSVTVVLRVEPAGAFEWLVGDGALKLAPGAAPPEVRVRPVLFNLGVNEMQSIANATGGTSIQTEINELGVTRLHDYYRDYAEFLSSGEGSTKTLGDLPELFFYLTEKASKRSTSSLERKKEKEK
jgi:hypothetical protein